MKRCPLCKTYSPDESLFCNACGGTFGRKVCPKHHLNPASADYCAICGAKLPPVHPTSKRPLSPLIPMLTVLVGLTLVVFIALLAPREPISGATLFLLGLLFLGLVLPRRSSKRPKITHRG